MDETPIPDQELTVLLNSVAEAVDLASEGEVLNGLRCLLGGQERAQEAADFDEPWGEALLAKYRDALLRYTERYGLKVE